MMLNDANLPFFNYAYLIYAHTLHEFQPIEGETLQKLDEGSMSSMTAGLLGGLSGDAPPVAEGTSLSGLDGGNFQLDGLMGGLTLEGGASGAPPAPADGPTSANAAAVAPVRRHGIIHCRRHGRRRYRSRPPQAAARRRRAEASGGPRRCIRRRRRRGRG